MSLGVNREREREMGKMEMGNGPIVYTYYRKFQILGTNVRDVDKQLRSPHWHTRKDGSIDAVVHVAMYSMTNQCFLMCRCIHLALISLKCVSGSLFERRKPIVLVSWIFTRLASIPWYNDFSKKAHLQWSTVYISVSVLAAIQSAH